LPGNLAAASRAGEDSWWDLVRSGHRLYRNHDTRLQD
jgi:hypothetical protein